MPSKLGFSVASLLRRLLCLPVLLVALQCQSARSEPTGGETHFLSRCSDAKPCPGSLVCACGVCTQPCSDEQTCQAWPTASCSQDSCASHCDVGCQNDLDCTALSPEHRCAAGRCRSGRACEPGSTSANQVVILGDAFFAAEHRVTAYLEDVARANGALSAGERYRDYSSLVGNALAYLGRGIEAQYRSALQETPVRVVIMNGGGADVLGGSCDVVSAACPLLTEAAAAASALFEQMATDGVEHVVFAFYPDPSPPELREKVDALRPLLEQACSRSPVPCEWVDLRPAFAGREATHLEGDGIVPTAEGAQATAAAIAGAMQSRCIAP